MSGGAQPNHADWLQQAERDLLAARLLLEHGFYEWSAYASCQSSEKSCKAIVIALGTNIGDAGGLKTHSLNKLLGGLPSLQAHSEMANVLVALPLHDQPVPHRLPLSLPLPALVERGTVVLGRAPTALLGRRLKARRRRTRHAGAP